MKKKFNKIELDAISKCDIGKNGDIAFAKHHLSLNTFRPIHVT